MTPTAITRRTAALFVALLAGVVLTGCGATFIDAADSEKKLKTEIPELAEVDMKVTSVTCPEDEEFVKGAVLNCDYTVEDKSKGTAAFKIVKVEGGEYQTTITSLAAGQLEQFLIEVWDGEGTLASVECADKVKDQAACDFEDNEGDGGTLTVKYDKDGVIDDVAVEYA
jgi:hypothetical protein